MVSVDLVEHVAVLVLVGVSVLLMRLMLLLLLLFLLLLHKLIMLLLSRDDPLFIPGGCCGGGGGGCGGLAGVGSADDGGGLGPQRVAVVLRQGHLEEGVGVADELVDVPLACVSVGGEKECIIPA